MTFEESVDNTDPDMTALDDACDPIYKVIDNLDLSLQSVAKDIGESQQLLSTSFGYIAARFAQVHSIAVAGEGQGAAPSEMLIALRRVVDALTVELQFEDSLNQLLGRVLSRIESISVALSQTRAMAERACCAQDEGKRSVRVLAVLGRTLESLRNAERPRGGRQFDTESRAVDLF